MWIFLAGYFFHFLVTGLLYGFNIYGKCISILNSSFCYPRLSSYTVFSFFRHDSFIYMTCNHARKILQVLSFKMVGVTSL